MTGAGIWCTLKVYVVNSAEDGVCGMPDNANKLRQHTGIIDRLRSSHKEILDKPKKHEKTVFEV